MIKSSVIYSRSEKKRGLTSEAKYYTLQKVVGMAVFLVGVFGGIFIKDATPILVLSTIGVELVLTKRKFLIVGDVYWSKNKKKHNTEEE